MTPLDVLDVFDAMPGNFALIATYEFDPLFFERRMLRKKALGSAARILVLMDLGRYQELINQGLSVSGFNRRYLVVPINRRPYVFHPKLYLLLGDRRVSGIVGSNNCTNAGIAYNMELCSVFSVGSGSAVEADRPTPAVLRQIYNALRTFASDAGAASETIEREFFKPIEEQHPWLHRNVVELTNQRPIELLHSHREPLWPQLKKQLGDKTVRKIAILAPFYDRDLGFLKMVKPKWPDAQLSIIAQQKYATLEGKKIAALLRSGKKGRLLAVTPPAGRRLHAKAFAFETSGETFWLTGSANATEAAMDGRNTESVLWFSTKEPIESILKDDSLTIETLDPSKFQSGAGTEPTNNDSQPVTDLRLESATLHEGGSLDLGFEAAAGVQDLTLRIKNFNEAQPFLSLRVRNPAGGEARLELEDNQIGQIHGAALCELKGIQNGRQIQSNRAALVQLNQLLKERTADGGSNNPLRKISETGEDLVPYLDKLGTVREAIEFLNHCSIRFEDGQRSSRTFGASFWKARDPFVGDIPTQWLMEPIDNTAKDLRGAIWDFIERHQSEKLEKHIRRGNLNGLPNFLDIFRTLNGLLLTFNKRQLRNAAAVLPHPFVTQGIMTNVAMLIGSFDDEGDYQPGFIDSIMTNFEGDREIVRERLQQERVPQMLWAAVEAMINVRLLGLKRQALDTWSMAQLKRASDWITRQGLPTPNPEDVKTAGLEYAAVAVAA
jgi:hypothetical protein